MYSLTIANIEIPYLYAQNEDGTAILDGHILLFKKNEHLSVPAEPFYYEKGKIWKKNNKKHRKNKPSIEYENGNEEYWIKGQRHRNPMEGPAVKYAIKDFYFLSGNQCFLNIQENGTKEIYIFKGLLKKFYLYSNSNFDSIPSIIYPNGDKEWWFMGKRHRENGPAVIYGNKHYYFEYGNFIKYEEF